MDFLDDSVSDDMEDKSKPKGKGKANKVESESEDEYLEDDNY
jgi:hypothetical protein